MGHRLSRRLDADAAAQQQQPDEKALALEKRMAAALDAWHAAVATIPNRAKAAKRAAAAGDGPTAPAPKLVVPEAMDAQLQANADAAKACMRAYVARALLKPPQLDTISVQVGGTAKLLPVVRLVEPLLEAEVAVINKQYVNSQVLSLKELKALHAEAYAHVT